MNHRTEQAILNVQILLLFSKYFPDMISLETTNLDLHANQIGLFKLKALSYIYISYYNNIVYLFLFPGDFHLNWISFTLYKFKCIHLILTFVARRELSGYDKLPLAYISTVFIFISPFKHEELFLVANKFCNDDKYNFSPPQVCETTVFSLQCYKVLFIIFLLHSTSFQNIGETTLVINQLPYLQELNYLISIR